MNNLTIPTKTQLQEGVAELEVFAHPARLLRLCRYLSEAYCATTRKAAVLPFIIASALPLDPGKSGKR